MKQFFSLRKLVDAAVINVVMYVLPLAGNQGGILNAKIFALAICSTILLVTQPSVSMKEVIEKRSTDKYSFLAIMLAAIVGQICMVIDWGYFSGGGFDHTLMTYTGLLLLSAGTLLRVKSILFLDTFFTATAETQPGQRVITGGPYAVIRHPSYLGALIAIAGSGLFLGAMVGMSIALALMVAAYVVRIRAEESVMASDPALGPQYREYQLRTKKLIPCVW